MKKKELKIYQSFQELELDQIRAGVEMSLEERWNAFWKLRKFHEEVFPAPASESLDDSQTKNDYTI
ncbi:hypothetical protein [Dyadobacter sp. CY323]|uniref:hypothetical protein n=1 Tax=Dyadobacter sp. CY323 TaxID=2907302 RepID=UPI001F45CD84|nr:hypothetical protein [Dyadobacter sp. CY323]MCE6992256.1 hypothetical protein [Dyadobacter sp. CY323]